MRLGLIMLLFMSVACVKDEGTVESSNISTTGGTSGGSTTTSGGAGGGTTGAVATDPLAAQAWHLENTGQNGYSLSSGKVGEDIKVKNVHGTMDIKGRNVRIAVSDSGIEVAHPDLTNNLLSGEHRNYGPSDPDRWHNADPAPADGEAHGTAVSGLIGAEGWNNIGSRGVAPLAKVAGFRFIMSYAYNTTSASMLARTLDQMDGNFDIFNYSYGKSQYIFIDEDPQVLSGVATGATTFRNGKGALYVQSSGNSYTEPNYFDPCEGTSDPACPLSAAGNTNSNSAITTPYKIIVGATNASGIKSSYSTPGSGIWVSAPGGEFGISSPAMISTDILGCNAGISMLNPNYPYFDFGAHPANPFCDYTNRMNGTSSAAPVTSGVIALMLEANPNLTWRDVKHILARSSDVIDNDFYPLFNTLEHPFSDREVSGYIYDEKWIQNGANIWFSNWYGFGRVNAEQAVTMARNYVLGSLGTYTTQTYSSGVISEIIPNADIGTGASNTINVTQNLKIEAVQIKITTDHLWPGDLAIHLVSPSGTESRLLNINNDIFGEGGLEVDTVLLSNAFYLEDSIGPWTIKIYDGSSEQDSGNYTLTNWKIIIHGH